MNFSKMKDFFLTRNSKKLTGIIAASLVVVIALAGLLIYQGTKKNVSLTIDGEHKVVKSHANTVKDILEELEIQYKEQDYLSPSTDTKVKDDLEIVWKPALQVVLTVDEQIEQVWTTADTVEEFLKMENIDVGENDRLNVALDTEIKNDLDIQIDKAFEVVLNDGGEEQLVWSTSTTVVDFLSQQGIKLNELDRIEPDLDQMIKQDSKVVNITRVEKVTDVVEEPIDFAVVTKNDSEIESGKEQIVQEGKKGKVKKAYEVLLENGQQVEKTLISEEIVENTQDRIVAVGTKKKPAETTPVQTASRGESSGKEFYVTATAYTANCNGCTGTTASGLNLHANPNVKVIAVDPRVIPLGTKVHVEGYGYAVASDTGGAIKGNKIDVFMPNKSDAYRWGVKKVKIKILK